MLELLKNPEVAICVIVENFTADGIGENLGWVCDEKNVEMMQQVEYNISSDSLAILYLF